MRRTPYQIAIEVDRMLCLSLSHREFEVMAHFIGDSEDPDQTGKNIILCGEKAAWYIIETEPKK